MAGSSICKRSLNRKYQPGALMTLGHKTYEPYGTALAQEIYYGGKALYYPETGAVNVGSVVGFAVIDHKINLNGK